MIRTSCTNLYNVLNHSLVINWRLDQIVLIRCFGVGGGGGGLLIFGDGINAKDMQSLQILDFQRFGYKNTKKLPFLVIPRGKELDHRDWTYDRKFELLSGSEMGGI